MKRTKKPDDLEIALEALWAAEDRLTAIKEQAARRGDYSRFPKLVAAENAYVAAYARVHTV